MNASALVRPALRRATVLVTVVALWFAATLGLMHRTLHDPAGAIAPGVAHALAVEGGPGHAHGHGLARLFGLHGDGDAQCRLYDQLAGGAPLPAVAVLLLPVVLPTAVFDCFQGEALARWVALFDARGPPAAR